MEKKKNLLSNIIICVVCIIAFPGGVFIGRATKARQADVIPPPANVISAAYSSSYGYTYTNPLLECESDGEMLASGIRSFQPKIEALIRHVTSKNKNLHVSYYFNDLEGFYRFGVNDQEQFHPASLMKVLVLATALKEAQQDAGFLGGTVTFHSNEFKGVDESEGFYPKEDGKSYTIKQLIDQMIQYSDNAAALMLMRYLGNDRFEAVMRDLNIPVPKELTLQSNYISLRSYTAIFEYLFNARYLNAQMSEVALAGLSDVKYTKGIRAMIPDSIYIAQKFGEREETDQVGVKHCIQLHHVAIVYYPGRPFLLGIMTRGGEREEKEKIIRDLTELTYTDIDRQMKSVRNSYLYAAE